MDFTKKIMPISTVFTEMVDDELIILDTQSENYFSLDSIGMEMWEQLRQHHSPQILYTYMLEHYEVEASVLKKDIETFIKNLLTHRLIIGET